MESYGIGIVCIFFTLEMLCVFQIWEACCVVREVCHMIFIIQIRVAKQTFSVLTE